MTSKRSATARPAKVPVMAADDLRAYMDDYGYDADTLAGELGVHPVTIRKWRNGEGLPRLTQLALKGLAVGRRKRRKSKSPKNGTP